MYLIINEYRAALKFDTFLSAWSSALDEQKLPLLKRDSGHTHVLAIFALAELCLK